MILTCLTEEETTFMTLAHFMKNYAIAKVMIVGNSLTFSTI